MKTLKIRKVGNSLGLVLPKDVLDQLNLGEGDELHLAKVDGELRLTPFDTEIEVQMEIVREEMARFRNALKTLAE